ncbi:MAG: aspartate racemase [Acidobacteria bacterium]|nr:MAG: aspartate racemase [Acidobacteriota bacterium]
MKTAGLIGGLGPESTMDYYRRIVDACNPAPPLIINSLDVQKIIAFMTSDRAAAVDYLVREIQRLADAHADFGAIAANTPHILFDEVQARSAIPLISIVETVYTAARTAGLKRLGLLGTRFTMREGLYPDAAVPTLEEQELIHDKYINELLEGRFLPKTRALLLRIVDQLIERHHIDGLILGGTELPLLLRDTSYHGVRFLDTTAIHVDAIVAAIHSDAAI